MPSPGKIIKLNEHQEPFVKGKERYSAFIGGIGSGKTFSGIIRGLAMSQQPRVGMHGPRGLIAAVSYDVLMDVVLPEFEEICDGTDLLVNYAKSRKVAEMKGGGSILFRSLDRPNWMRGLQLSWFYLDEGRHLSKGAWDVLVGRMRQPGYEHAGWVCSTPNGYDWMWELFHEDSPDQRNKYTWFHAPTTSNAAHLDDDYIPDLEANYSDRDGKLTLFGRQEILGEFVGVTEGAVFPEWNPSLYVKDVPFDPDLPLYSFWDFGIGDLAVVLFVQVAQQARVGKAGRTDYVSELRVIGCIEAANRNAREWAAAWEDWLSVYAMGTRPVANYGDPAGRARSAGSGTSVMADLAACNVYVAPAQKRPADYGIRIIKNMIEGGRVYVDANRATRLSAALSSCRWGVDANGRRTPSKEPVHNWTSHFVAALRYGASSLLSFFPRHGPAPAVTILPEGSMGHVLKQLSKPPSDFLGPQGVPTLTWRPSEPVGVPHA